MSNPNWISKPDGSAYVVIDGRMFAVGIARVDLGMTVVELQSILRPFDTFELRVSDEIVLGAPEYCSVVWNQLLKCARLGNNPEG